MATRKVKFYKILEEKLSARNLEIKDICDETDAVEVRILNEYGAIFLAHESVIVTPVCVFTSAKQVNKFQKAAGTVSEEIAGTKIELQPFAIKALLEACQEAQTKNLDITPRGGAEAGRRDFEDTFRLWNSRFLPACEYWKAQGKLDDEQILRLKSVPVKEQVKEVLELEKQGIFFNTFFNRSILSSVAAPGASQHLSMLAFDAAEFSDKTVRRILAKHGWFRTVQDDAPHFTYLGHKEKDLKKLGLKKVETEDGEFWIPDV